jgi:hypothetical protein
MHGSTLQGASPLGRARPPLHAAPGALAAGLLLLLVAAYVLSAAAAGGLGLLVDPEGPLHLSHSFRFNLVLLLVLAFTFWAGLNGNARVAEDFRALRPVLDLSDEQAAAVAEPDAAGRPRQWLAAAFGAGLGLAIFWLGTPPDPEAPRLGFHGAWNLPVTLVLFAMMGRLGWRSWRLSRVLGELGRRHTRVSLLERAPLAPFARCGLRLARDWFLGSAIAMLLLIDAYVPGLVAAVIAATLALGVGSLLLPCLGVHQRLREAKRAELARLRAAIEARSCELFAAGAAGAESEARLPALLAWEARVAAASEWPFDTLTLLRFALLVLIPLGSWVAGAMVERALDAVLR